MKMKEDLIRSLGKNVHHHSNKAVDSSAHVAGGNKVLPISDSTSSSSLSSLSSSKADDDQKKNTSSSSSSSSSSIKDETTSSKSNKTLSRMKELLRWAAAAKSDRGKLGRKVMHFRNRSATIIKTDDEIKNNNESPKISIKWEVGSCDTSCSAASAPPSIRYDESSHHRTGNWITTDDEFVVLEL